MLASVRDLHSGKRAVTREQPLQAALDASASRLEAGLANPLVPLSANQRGAVLLRHWHAYSLMEITERLGCTTAAVIGCCTGACVMFISNSATWSKP
jgi:DNA-directed RNA polymerase specialized sigma24 family protein